MTSRATASSSAVVTPGTAAARTASRASATTSPARRMSRTCSGDLYSMRSRPSIVGSLRREDGDGVQDARGDLVDVPDPVDAHEQPALGVRVGQGLGLLGVDVES